MAPFRKVRFSKAVASRVRESIWHPSQRLEEESDGSVTFTAKVAGTLEITPWILSWGAEAEVLSPQQRRRRFAEMAERQAALYSDELKVSSDSPATPSSPVTL
jgi:predicted DNA-binding transcriptional regulator YafY